MSAPPVISPISPVAPAVPPHVQLHHTPATTRAEGAGAGLFSNPVVDRRGGPMDVIDATVSEQYHQHRPTLHPQFSSASGHSSPSQQSFKSAQSSLSNKSMSGSSNSNSSSNYLRSYQTPPPNPPQSSQQQEQQYHVHFPSPPTAATTSSSLTSASGHLAPPPPEKSKSRRWSLTGRFFEKRKSITEPFNIPSNLSQPPKTLSTESYSSSNSNIVHGLNTGVQQRTGGERASNSGSGVVMNNDKASNLNSGNVGSGNNVGNDSNGKVVSPPGSNPGSRRSSLADIPKAFLSSFRRSSITVPPPLPSADVANNHTPISASNTSNNNSNGGNYISQTGSLQVQGVQGGANNARGTERRLSDQSDSSERAAWLGAQPLITMAVPKGPPQDPWSLAQRLPVKGILKKRSSDTSVNGEGRGGAGGPGMVTSAALAGAGGDDDTKGDIKPGDSSTSSSIGVTSDVAAQLHNPAPVSAATARRPSALASEDIHPMATPDMGLDAIKLLTSTDHRARLVTNSPPPAHPHKAPLPPPLALDSKAPTDLAGEQDGVIKVPLVGGAGSPPPGSNSTSNGSNNKDSESAVTGTKAFTPVSQGAALPPDYFTPGMQSNLHKDRGDGERTRGAVVRDEISQDELLTQQMLTLSARAQDLANQYYDPRISNGSSGQGAIQGGLGGSSGGGGGLMVPGAGGQQGGPKRRSINFLDKIEIIPAHRKSEYNRSSDKHATFRILTPDLKSEIRDELNTYKMREMAVHVESMGNTAFH